jgi:hypothetical protein
MNKAYPELAGALSRVPDAIDAGISSTGYAGKLIDMYLAGGLSVNYCCGTRYTQDVGASFSKRLLPAAARQSISCASVGAGTKFRGLLREVPNCRSRFLRALDRGGASRRARRIGRRFGRAGGRNVAGRLDSCLVPVGRLFREQR